MAQEEWWKDSKTAAWSSAKSWENRQLSTRLQGLPVLASVWGLPRWVPGVWLRLPDGQLTINLIDQVCGPGQSVFGTPLHVCCCVGHPVSRRCGQMMHC